MDDVASAWLMRNLALRKYFTSDCLLAIAHMKPTSSRAIVVIATVLRLPRAIRARQRFVRRACAFQAVSRTASGMCRVAK